MQGRISAQVAVVISDRSDAAGIGIAQAMGLKTRIVERKSAPDRSTFERELTRLIDLHSPDLVLLAGFMRVLSAEFVAHYAGRMLNIHPSLLPKYRGLHTHQRVLEAGDSEHGASVHFVTAELDGGPVVLQSRVPVMAGDTEAALTARVQATEHVIYPRVVSWVADGRLVCANGHPVLDGRPVEQPIVEDMQAHVSA